MIPGETDLAALANLACGLAREAGSLLLGYYEGSSPSEELTASIRSKSTRTDLVTEADRASERLILERLRDERPDGAVIAEEGGSREGTSGLTWVVDPLDGTINFVYGFPAFAVSVACQAGDERLVGAVYDPLRGEMFEAQLGRGSRLDGKPLRMSGPPPLAEALVATGFGYDANRRQAQARLLATVLPSIRDIRRAGAAALDLCWLATGRVDACYEAGLAPWDLAAGALVVTEAGGSVEVVDGLVPGAATVVAGFPALCRDLSALLETAKQAARPARS